MVQSGQVCRLRQVEEFPRRVARFLQRVLDREHVAGGRLEEREVLPRGVGVVVVHGLHDGLVGAFCLFHRVGGVLLAFVHEVDFVRRRVILVEIGVGLVEHDPDAAGTEPGRRTPRLALLLLFLDPFAAFLDLLLHFVVSLAGQIVDLLGGIQQFPRVHRGGVVALLQVAREMLHGALVHVCVHGIHRPDGVLVGVQLGVLGVELFLHGLHVILQLLERCVHRGHVRRGVHDADVVRAGEVALQDGVDHAFELQRLPQRRGRVDPEIQIPRRVLAELLTVALHRLQAAAERLQPVFGRGLIELVFDLIGDARVLGERHDVIVFVGEVLRDVEHPVVGFLLRVAQLGIDVLELFLALLHLLQGLLDLGELPADFLLLAFLHAVFDLLEFGRWGLLLRLLGIVLVGFAFGFVFLFLLQGLLERVPAVADEIELPGGHGECRVAEEREPPDEGGRAAGIGFAVADHVRPHGSEVPGT